MAFKMKAGKEGPMRKNFPGALKKLVNLNKELKRLLKKLKINLHQ